MKVSMKYKIPYLGNNLLFKLTLIMLFQPIEILMQTTLTKHSILPEKKNLLMV